MEVTGEGINQWDFTVKKGDSLVYQIFSNTRELEEVVVTAKAKKGSGKKSEETPKESLPEPVIKRFWPAGKYTISWTGFDKDGIYDSALMKNKEGFTVTITGQAFLMKKEFTLEKPVKFTHKEVDWVDVKIDKNNKRIDTTLRVNLKDGGAEGLECSTYLSGIRGNTQWKTKCPWDKISQEALNYYKKEPIKERTKNFEELRDLALSGIDEFWSRNSNNIGKGVEINDNLYETFVKSEQNENGMKAPKIIYQTNCEDGRSRNFELSRILFFYEGYLYKSDWKNNNAKSQFYRNKGWIYRSENNMEERNTLKDLPPLIDDYKMVAAHEIGHEILLAFGGHSYSKAHKGSTHWSMVIQNVNEDSPNIPEIGEIDLMKYYQDYYDIPRTIVSEFDLLKLIWLTKIQIQ